MGCLPLLTGLRTLLVINIISYIILLILAIVERNHSEAVLTLVLYAFIVYIPAIVYQFIFEFRADTRFLRKSIMVSAWYEVATSFFLDIFTLGYVIMFVNCKNEDD